jgi:hypothetical protein
VEMMIWNVVLTALVGVMGFLLKSKFDELQRISILLNKMMAKGGAVKPKGMMAGGMMSKGYAAGGAVKKMSKGAAAGGKRGK